MIDHLENGYLAQPASVEDLVNGINWYLDKRENIDQLRFNAREKAVKNYSQEIVAGQYNTLYRKLVQN